MPERLTQEKAFDVLSDVLETLHFRGSLFFRSDLAAPWGMSLSRSENPRFHIAVSGEFYVGSDDQELVQVNPHDVVMIPSGSSHWVSDKPGRELVPSIAAADACELNAPMFQSGEITNRLICGVIHFEQGLSHPIFAALPAVMHFRSLEKSGPIWSVINLIEAEADDPGGLNSGVVDRLTEVLFIQLMNNFVQTSENATGFLAALSDKRVYKALALIHKEPEYEWTLSVLGDRAGMSKATLVRRFHEVVGMAPMTYISDWRLMKAYSLIKHSMTPLEQIAEFTGFASARTLTRAFQRHYGSSPSALRRSGS